MSPKPSSSRIAVMRVFVVALCVCTALARPEDAKAAEKKPSARADPLTGPVPTTGAVKWINGAPVGVPQDGSIPNVSEDVLDKALSDRRFVQRQLKCATGEGPCDPIGRKIKAHAPLVMRGMCVKCTPSEIKQVQRVMSHIQKNYPKEYAKMLKQYQSGF